MNINRNNYEEFLLLYIDGELSSIRQKEVEFFLEQHADIQQEFNLLLDTKLQLDEVSFGDVSHLLKTENNEVGLENYEEKFLLYVDNELSTNEKKKVELFVLQHPTLQTAFTTINKAKLPIEIIEHPNKKSLYKTERKSIVFYLQRMAVAAIFIGLIAFVWNLVGSNKNQIDAVVNTIPSTNKDAVLPSNNKAKEVGNSTVINSTATTKKEEKQKAIIINSTLISNSKQDKKVSNEVVKNVATPTPQIIPKEEQNTLQQVSTNDIATAQNAPAKIVVPEVHTVSNIATLQPVISNHQIDAIAYKTLATTNDGTAKQDVQPSKLKKLFKTVTKIFTPKEITDDEESKKLFVITL